MSERDALTVRASVFVGVSLDGFLARPDGSFDFLPTEGGEDHGYTAFFASLIRMRSMRSRMSTRPWVCRTR